MISTQHLSLAGQLHSSESPGTVPIGHSSVVGLHFPLQLISHVGSKNKIKINNQLFLYQRKWNIYDIICCIYITSCN